MTFSLSSKARLTRYDLGRFPGNSLFDRLGRAVCEAECLPRKELYEAWQMARRVRRWFRGGRVVDLGAGHGLLAHVLLVLDNSSRDALAVDVTLPPSSQTLHEALVGAWPRLEGRVTFREQPLDTVPLSSQDLVVSSHACGAMADVVLDRAVAAGARVAVLPCCQDLGINETGPLSGWVDGPLAVDIMRAIRLEQRGYRVRTHAIPHAITPKNRLLLGEPLA